MQLKNDEFNTKHDDNNGLKVPNLNIRISCFVERPAFVELVGHVVVMKSSTRGTPS